MKTAHEMIMHHAANPPPEYVGKGVNAEKQQELHNKIISGEIDIGPMPDHTAPVKDIRPTTNGFEARVEQLASKNGKVTLDLAGSIWDDNRDARRWG